MSTTLSQTANCPNCGKPLPAYAPAGLCPACLLAQGMDTDPGGEPRSRFQPPPVEEIARLFPQLEILGLLGAGGMGAVYKARQPALDRLVALKVLPPQGAGGTDSGERFNREARALARLSHPNIVAVHEFGFARAGGLQPPSAAPATNAPDGDCKSPAQSPPETPNPKPEAAFPYFIMEFVDGANLRQLGRAARLSPREALQIIPQICDALQYAHDEGVVHRDIKPENVLVDRKGRVKIADFGLAKIFGPDGDALRLTADGDVMGTPHYMAPEQVERPLAVDHRADIYSLGVVFYELLTGDLPLGKFAPPSRKVSVDVRLDDVVLRALENDPARRYQRASEVKSQVETITTQPVTTAGSRREEASTCSVPAAMPLRRQLYWAGFPVVTEFGEEREVSWNGTLGALAMAFAMVAVGFFVVRLWSGNSNPGTLHVCSLFALLTVGLGVRRTLNQPRAEDSPRTAQGTVVLAPKRRWWEREQLAFVSIVVFVVAWSLFVIRWLQPTLRRQTGGPLIVAKLDPATGILRADVPGRGVIELLGVAETNAAPNQWWRPDGRVATNANYELHNLVETSRDGGRIRVFVFRAHDLPEGVDGPSLASTEPGAMMSSGGTVFSHGKPLSGGRPMVLALREPRRFAALRAGLALGKQRTVFSFDPTTRRAEQFHEPGDPRWNIAMHGAADTPNGAQITTVMSHTSTDWQVQVVAVDQTGRERTQRLASGSGVPSGGSLMLWTYSFPGVSLKEVKEFRVVVRRVQQFEFPDVALEPKGKLPEAQPLRLSAAQEITFSELLDLDTAKPLSFPPGLAESSARQSGEMRRWASERGFDLAAGVGELLVLNTDFALVKDEDWDRFTVGQVMDSLYKGRFAPSTLKPTTTSRTFSFETRDDSFGLLQIVGFGEGGFGATIRIKRVER